MDRSRDGGLSTLVLGLLCPLLSCPLLSCSGADDTAAAGGAPSVGPTFDVALDEITVAPGDTFECLYTGVWTDKELSIHGIDGVQAKGGHHITVYWTDATRTGHAPCTDEEMADWHMISGANTIAGGEPEYDLPDGIAFRVPAGKQIVAQLHYINTTGESYPAKDSISMHLVDAAEVTAYANLFTTVNGQIDLGPNSETTSAATATLAQDVQLFMYGGHMHELGQHIKVERVDEAGAPQDTIYDQDWDPSYASHPPVERFDPSAPFVLKKGERVRQTCTWNNTTAERVGFPREMCVFYGFYFPDKTGDEIIQIATPDTP